MKKQHRRYREKFTPNTFMVASTHANNRVHDCLKGWGTVANDGSSILWDWWRPITKKRRQELERHWKKQGGPFGKWVFPVIKNMGNMPSLKDIMQVQPMS